MDSVVIFIVVILFAAWITYYILKHLKNNTSLIFFKLSNYIYIFKLNRKRYIEAELNLIEKFLESIEIYKSNYFTNSLKIKLLEEYEGLYNKFQYGKFRYITNKDVDKFKNIYKDLDILVKKWNESYVENELIKNNDLLSNIDGKSLDYQQRKAVVVDEDNNLVLAGAGSGKTLTISGKVKYLVETKGINPQEILLISFTKKAANEMNDRINNRLGINIQSSTFHKLGLDIITKHKGNRLDVSERLNSSIDEYFKSTIYKQVENLERIIEFFGYYINIPKSIELFVDLGEYYKYCKSLDFVTLKGKQEIEKHNREHEDISKREKKTIRGEQVKSIEEVIIANYLYLNGVNYIYEAKYKYETGDRYRKQYRPDFYLPDYDIYIEHFGINRSNKTPWLSKIEEKKYIDGIKWKRDLHKENQTTLVETYSYYNTEGILLDKLREKLSCYNVKFKEIEYEQIYKDIIESKEDQYFKEMRKLIATFIGLFKSSGYSLDGFDTLRREANKIENKFLCERSLLFLDIVKPVYINYENLLLENKEIDFNDMINQSTEIVRNRLIELDYKYIIIDEYQDISKSRFNLIKEIKKQTNAKLMCVGDDWQSIYRFAGSDIDLFTNFGEYVGYYELLKIEKAYRNSQELIDIAGKYIMKNKKQLVKNLKSDKNNKQPIKMIVYADNICTAIDKSIDDIVRRYGDNSDVCILGRNNFDVKVLSKENTNGKYEYRKVNEDIIVKSNQYPNLKINYLTAHKSKGLEADNVIIINLENKVTGFPNQMADDPVLDLLLTESDKFDFSEERRLFYVALTRTKNTSYLLVPKYKSSIFCDELSKDFDIKIEDLDFKQQDNPTCPKCMSGHLLKRNRNNSSEFVGCSNYPACDFTSNYIDILEDTVLCESCKGYMVKREYKGEYFLGCTNYLYCKNTKKYNHTYEDLYNQDIISSEEIDQDCDTMSKEENTFYYDAGQEFERIEIEAIISENEDYNKNETIKDKYYDSNEEELNELYGIAQEELEDYYSNEVEIGYSYYCKEKDEFDERKLRDLMRTIIYEDNFYDNLIENELYEDDDIIYSEIIEETKEEDKLRDRLLQIINQKEISIEKKLWIEGFITYIQGEALYNIYSKEELDKIINCNRLIRDEWLLEDIEYIGTTCFYEYKNMLFGLDKQNENLKVNSSNCDMNNIEIYIKYKSEESYKHYKSCKLNIINHDSIKEILELDTEFVIREIYQDSVFIELKNLNNKITQFEFNEVNNKEKIELYINIDSNRYNHYKTCISEVNLEIGDTIKDMNKYLDIIDIKENKIYLKDIGSSSKNFKNINMIQNQIISLYIEDDEDCVYYKKCITNTKYEIGDLFKDNNKQFIISNIFKDTFLLKRKLD